MKTRFLLAALQCLSLMAALSTLTRADSTAKSTSALPQTQPTPRPAGAEQPNIVFIITDDQELETVQYMPRLQELLTNQGASFTNMFVTTPQCCPSHVSILTGQYPHNNGVLNNWYPTGGSRGFLS